MLLVVAGREDVHKEGLLAVDADGILLLGHHAVQEAPLARSDHHRRRLPAAMAIIRRHTRARRRRAVAVVVNVFIMTAVHIHPLCCGQGRRRRLVQVELQPPVPPAIVAAAHDSPPRSHCGHGHDARSAGVNRSNSIVYGEEFANGTQTIRDTLKT